MKEILIAIIIGIAIFFAFKYLIWPFIKIIVRYTFCLIKWLLITLSVWIVWILFFNDINQSYILWGIVGVSIVDFIRKLKDKETYYPGEHYVLNTKSKIAHSSWDSSADTISSDHRKDVYATEGELFRMGYRKKQDK